MAQTATQRRQTPVRRAKARAPEKQPTPKRVAEANQAETNGSSARTDSKRSSSASARPTTGKRAAGGSGRTAATKQTGRSSGRSGTAKSPAGRAKKSTARSAAATGSSRPAAKGSSRPAAAAKGSSRTAAVKEPAGAAKGTARSAAASARSGAGRVRDAVTPTRRRPLFAKLARKAAMKAAKTVGRRALAASAEAARAAVDRTATAGKTAVENGMERMEQRPPIQVSIDVAVPLQIAWDEWMQAGTLPEGVHRIENVERDGNDLIGSIAGPRSTDWAAEIIDERDQESFAWRSVEGSDCAGLVTFHRLSERLTRIELDLDVVPTNPAEAVTLALHLAHHRAETDLRRFKAHVEFINPDVYADQLSSNGSGPKAEERASDSDTDIDSEERED